MWTILIFIVIGMVAGWAASLLIRREKYPTDWGVLFIIGILGSLIAGIVVHLIVGDGFKLAPGGIIRSIAVASESKSGFRTTYCTGLPQPIAGGTLANANTPGIANS